MTIARAILWIIIAALLVLLGWSVYQFFTRRQQTVEVTPAPTIALAPATASPVAVTPKPTATPAQAAKPTPAATAKATVSPRVARTTNERLPQTGPDMLVYAGMGAVGLAGSFAAFRQMRRAGVKKAYRR